MGINYKKIKTNHNKYNIDKQLLMDIEYKEMLFIISKEVVKYREEKKLTQTQLGEKMGIKQEMVSKIESGNYNPSVKFLVEIWSKLSDESINFAAILLRRMYEKVNKNYNYIQIELKTNNEELQYRFKDEATCSKIMDTNTIVINKNLKLVG